MYYYTCKEEVIFMNLVNVLAEDVICDGITFPGSVVGLLRTGIFIIQVVVPILLILWGMLDFAKGIIGQDEDKIKAGQKKFIQRLIAAIIVFLIVTVVQIVINTVGNLGGEGNKASSAWKCANNLIRDNEE